MSNYMGGRGKNARARSNIQNKTNVKTKQHFASRGLTSRQLNPTLSSFGAAKKPTSRPVFDFSHAHTHAVPVYHSDEAATEKAAPLGPKRITPSKAFMKRELAEPISYNYWKRKVLDEPNLAGLSKRHRVEPPKHSSSSSVLATPTPAARLAQPFPLDLELDDEPPTPSPMERQHHSQTKSGQPQVRPSQDPFKTPQRPSSQAVRRPSPAMSFHSNSPILGSDDHWSTQDMLDAEADYMEHTGELTDAIWDSLACQMGLEFPLEKSSPTNLPFDDEEHEGFPPTERAGADYRLAFCSDKLPAPKVKAVKADMHPIEEEMQTQSRVLSAAPSEIESISPSKFYNSHPKQTLIQDRYTPDKVSQAGNRSMSETPQLRGKPLFLATSSSDRSKTTARAPIRGGVRFFLDEDYEDKTGSVRSDKVDLDSLLDGVAPETPIQSAFLPSGSSLKARAAATAIKWPSSLSSRRGSSHNNDAPLSQFPLHQPSSSSVRRRLEQDDTSTAHPAESPDPLDGSSLKVSSPRVETLSPSAAPKQRRLYAKSPQAPAASTLKSANGMLLGPSLFDDNFSESE